jgi:hypothetical protein
VKTGREADGKVEIFGDLAPGDMLILTATDEIRNGSALTNVRKEEKSVSSQQSAVGKPGGSH